MRHSHGSFRTIGLVSAISSQLAGGILVGIFAGKWMDEQFSTDPLFMIIGLLTGLGAGTYGTIHLAGKYTGDD
ncbi:AtpZ/AtpI family protein [Salimicrobium flavidum]|uniref:AtpZ/AtpI family protein n=1 Tax=Salimicrobium flavidum TaxID=570947 RepID=UPI000970B9C0|nr:AtpZ/AtpI family protein [Salimicrobium flavidum]